MPSRCRIVAWKSPRCLGARCVHCFARRGHVLSGAGKFVHRGGAAQRRAEGGGDALVISRMCIDQLFCPRRGSRVQQVAIHEEQRLDGCVREGPLRDADGRISAIEHGQMWMPLNPLRHQINAAAIARIDRIKRVVLHKHPRAHVGEGVRAARTGVQLSADQEQRVGVATRPLPKWCCQSRFNITRARQRVGRVGDPLG